MVGPFAAAGTPPPVGLVLDTGLGAGPVPAVVSVVVAVVPGAGGVPVAPVVVPVAPVVPPVPLALPMNNGPHSSSWIVAVAMCDGRTVTTGTGAGSTSDQVPFAPGCTLMSAIS